MPKSWKPSIAHYIRILYYIFRFRKNQWLKVEELRAIQENRLRKMIDHAYHNVPYYHEMFDSHGIKPDDIRTMKDLQKLAITTKKDIQLNYPDKMIAKGTHLKQCRIKTTSGSTGRPISICLGNKSMAYYAALGYFAFFECSLRLTDNMVSLEIPDQPIQKTWFQKLGILRREVVTLLQPIERIIEALRAMKPDVIYGHPSMLTVLAKEIEEKSITGISPRIVITHAETLTDHSREKIADAFNAVVCDIYGSVESSSMIFQCRECMRYHMISDGVIIEFIKNDKNITGNKPGEIVITSLYNYEMPLIRYKLGDVGIPSNEKCTCGRGFPLISSIEGRSDDFLILPSGKTISPRGIKLIKYVPGITEYRIIQEEKDRFVVQVVKGKGFGKDTVSQIKTQIQNLCIGEDVRCEVELVEELPRERTGKLRKIISKVQSHEDISNRRINT